MVSSVWCPVWCCTLLLGISDDSNEEKELNSSLIFEGLVPSWKERHREALLCPTLEAEVHALGRPGCRDQASLCMGTADLVVL